MMTDKTHSLNRYHIAVIGLAFFAFFMSTLISRTVYERLPHLEDEVAYLYQAKIFAHGDMVIPSPQPRRSYWQPFVIDYQETRFSKYTPGWSAMLAVGVALGETWIINAFFAALTVALVFRLGRDIFNRDVGLIAAGLTAFSPMALLLNASLMGHSAALFFTTLFLLAYLRIEQSNRLKWGLVAGVALGCIVILRPLTAVGVATPFIIWSVIRVLKAFLPQEKSSFVSRLITVLPSLMLLSLCTLVIAIAIPIYNNAATGEPSRNLYRFVWDYDQIGFGKCCGRSGHTLERAVNHTRYDLSLTAADVFGWQNGAIDDKAIDHWLNQSDYFPNIGLGFFLLPFGVLIGIFAMPYGLSRRRGLALTVIWLIALGVLLAVALDKTNDSIRDPQFSWAWIVMAWGCLLVPLFLMIDKKHRQARWTWLLLSIVLGLVLAQMTYWIGSQRYSTRYYFEALSSMAILSAVPLAYLAQKWRKLPIYGVLCLLLLWSLYAYSTPRISALYRFNFIGQDLLDEIQARRETDKPLLVLVSGAPSGDDTVRWRALGTLMVVTSPYRDSEIVGAWDFDSPDARAQILADYPDREIIEMHAEGNDIQFVEESN